MIVDVVDGVLNGSCNVNGVSPLRPGERGVGKADGKVAVGDNIAVDELWVDLLLKENDDPLEC